jgi:hypothetical protein
MVDALIHWPDRRPDALEVVQDGDTVSQQQHAALQSRTNGQSVEVEGLKGSWMVQLARGTSVARALETLPSFLRSFEEEHAWYDPRTESAEVEAQRKALGIARMVRRSDRPPRLYLRRVGSAGPWLGEDALCDWLEDVLKRHADVPRKLLAHDSPGRHAFIWATMTSDIHAHLVLGEGWAGPNRQLEVPSGITDVWAASWPSPARILRWNRGSGWADYQFDQ